MGTFVGRVIPSLMLSLVPTLTVAFSATGAHTLTGVAFSHRPCRIDQLLIIGCDAYWGMKREKIQQEGFLRKTLLAEAETREAMYITKLSECMADLRAARQSLAASVPIAAEDGAVVDDKAELTQLRERVDSLQAEVAATALSRERDVQLTAAFWLHRLSGTRSAASRDATEVGMLRERVGAL